MELLGREHSPSLFKIETFSVKKVHLKMSKCHPNNDSHFFLDLSLLTHWGRVTLICVSKLTIIGSDNGLSPGRRQAIIKTNAGILLIGTLGTNFSEILSEIHKKKYLKMSSGRCRPFCLSLNVLSHPYLMTWVQVYVWARRNYITFSEVILI